MKIRNEFVSNSSSCSFIVHIETQEDADVFNQLLPRLKKIQPKIVLESMLSPDDYLASAIVQNASPEEWLNVNAGEDSLDNIDRLQDIEDEISYTNLKTYKDKYAHYTFGEDLKKGKDNDF